MRKATSVAFVALCSLVFAGCSGGSGGGGGIVPTPTPSTTSNEWTWESGSSTTNATGVYGALGVGSLSNIPGSRDGSTVWTDSSGNFWLFGGETPSTQTNISEVLVNDLWEFSATSKMWTWVSGSNSVPAGVEGRSGVYGALGVSSASDVPGGRDGAVSWSDSNGNLWLFGGWGIDSSGVGGYLNDLWEYNPSAKAWTWIGGSSTVNAVGVYGTKGVASAGSFPGARSYDVGWTDRAGDFWLFGGGNATSEFNDLWEFNPTTKEWTWVSGSNTAGARGVYGSLGTASSGNVPGARGSGAAWVDSSGNFWLFGGAGLDSNGNSKLLNDLWEFNPGANTWTWESGSNVGGAAGTYGTLGSGATGNSPGARNSPVSWVDSKGNLWLFGGDGFDSTGTGGGIGTSLNDLWKFSLTGRTWTWVSGSNLENAAGVYGTLGVTAASNIPGSRYSAVGWTDSSGNLWLFGGQTGYSGNLNDLWKYQPQ